MAIMAVVGGPGGSVAADDSETTGQVRAVHSDRARGLPMVGPSTHGIAEFLSTLETGAGWDEATPAR